MTQEQSVYPVILSVSISAPQSVSRNSEGHMKSVQPMKCMLFILCGRTGTMAETTMDEMVLCTKRPVPVFKFMMLLCKSQLNDEYQVA